MLALPDPPVAKGSERHIYRDLRNPGRVIKVLIASGDQRLRPGFRAATQRLLPGLRHRAIAKEYGEYTRQMLLHPDAPMPLAHLHGFVLTEAGLGCVAEAVLEGEDLAPSLAERPIAPADIPLLNAMCARIFARDIRASDLSASNVVIGDRGQGREAVLVDGFGDIHAVPIRTWSRALNRLALISSFTKMGERLGLSFDRETLTFEK